MSTTLPDGNIVTLPSFPNVATILASLQAAVNGLESLITNFNPGVVETYLESNALALGSDASSYPNVSAQGAYEILLAVQNAAFILTAQGNALDLKAADVGTYRKPATKSTGPYVFKAVATSASPQLIAAGAVVSSDPADPTASPTLFVTLQDATIPANGSMSNIVEIQAYYAGSAGDALPGAVNRVISGATNVTGTNPESISGGQDTEQDDSPNGGLRGRALKAVANASQGTIAALEGDAETYAGVTDAVLVENTADDGVTPLDGRGQLYVDDGTGDLGDSANENHAVIATIQADFDRGLYRAAGTQVHVVGSQLLAVTITLVVDISLSYTTQIANLETVTAAIQAAVYNYVQTVGIGKPVLLSEIIRYVAEVDGVSNVPVNAIIINGAIQDLQPSAIQVPRCANFSSITVYPVIA